MLILLREKEQKKRGEKKSFLTIQHNYSLLIINLHHFHILRRNLLPSHPPSHLLPRKNPRPTTLRLPRRAHGPMRQGNTMTGRLPFKPPPLHPARKAHPPTIRPRIHKLALQKPTRINHLPDPQQALLILDFELYQMSLRTDFVFGIMPQQRPRHVARMLPAAPNLYCEIAVLLPSLVSNDLDAIHLDDGAWVPAARFGVVDCHHSLLYAQSSRA